jgi:membrane associated rhomboid family serine protease
MNNFIAQTTLLVTLIKKNIATTLAIIGFLWLVQLVNYLLNYRLNILGIYPRHIVGLRGILFAPFLHGSFSHLFFNTIPLLVLIDFTLFAGLYSFLLLTAIIMLLAGLLIWCFGRSALHIGASYLVMGYWGYLLVNAYQHPSLISVVLVIVCLYYFGGLLFSFFPTEDKVSWEGHLFGFIAGIATVYSFPLIMNSIH